MPCGRVADSSAGCSSIFRQRTSWGWSFPAAFCFSSRACHSGSGSIPAVDRWYASRVAASEQASATASFSIQAPSSTAIPSASFEDGTRAPKAHGPHVLLVLGVGLRDELRHDRCVGRLQQVEVVARDPPHDAEGGTRGLEATVARTLTETDSA